MSEIAGCAHRTIAEWNALKGERDRYKAALVQLERHPLLTPWHHGLLERGAALIVRNALKGP